MQISKNSSININFFPVDAIRGKSYWKGYIAFRKKEINRDEKYSINRYDVESESSDTIYHVNIIIEKGTITKATCSCPRYNNGYNCKHIAAVLYNYGDEMIKKAKTPEVSSLQILNMFYEKDKPKKIKKELNLAINLSIKNSNNNTTIYPNIKIGTNKLYTLNNRFKNFYSVYNGEDNDLVFGKDLAYNCNDYYFSEENKKLIEFLHTITILNEKYSYTPELYITKENFNKFIDILNNISFTVNDSYHFNKIFVDNPYEMTLKKINNTYHFKINATKDMIILSNDFVISNNKLYYLPDKISRLITAMKKEELEELLFNEQELEIFTKGILKNIKDTIKLDESVKDEIIITTTPKIKLFLDIDQYLICKPKLIYRNQEIDYFEENNNILRDTETEDALINDLISYNFKLAENALVIDDIDLIGEFLENDITKLSQKYDVFTSQNLKQTSIRKNLNITSSFKIGQDNIMSYEFDLDGIDNKEILNILNELKRKKKYYKLKNGNLINLEENDKIKELDKLINNMDLSEKDIKNGFGIIPKYKAIYLDSLKNNYQIIKTNNLFDELINNFNSYKNIKINLKNTDKKILRDYQITGIEWLYNIYKCGFGGILADEMGLGKSIQLIYFIKEIIKEKKDAKVLIIAPTSLVYNWKKEFDKFGRELKYKVFAENKIKRHEDLENLENINILITTYGLIREDYEYYQKINFEAIAIDEAQNIKNSTAQMTKFIKSLHGNTKLALTGTPLENSVLELWSIFDFIMPGYLTSITTFNKKYNIKDTDNESLKILDDLKKQVHPFILRRKKKDVIKDLPDKIENNIYLDLEAEQKKLYLAELEKTKKKMDTLLQEDQFNKSKIEILKLLTKLRQICIDPSIIYENYTGESTKIKTLIPMIKDIIASDHKILLFSTYKTAVDIIHKEFIKNGISSYIIDGSVTSKKRMKLVEDFNNDDTNVFLITLKAGGTGLNLTSADIVIHLDLWWNPQAENQATDRAHRIGQKRNVEVIKLICKGTIEERILELQNKKKILSDNLIEEGDINKNIIAKLSADDIKHLLAMDNDIE